MAWFGCSMSDLIIREASELDVPAMALLRKQSGWDGGGSAERMRLYLRGEHHPQYAKATRTAFVAEDSHGLVGFIAGHLTTRFQCDGELQWLLVAPALRGGPTAVELWEYMRSWFVAQGMRRICVNVEPSNERARRFYARTGAMELLSHWMVWPDIASGQ
jgi:ribosomal protein S18 acetylase RimI-like enzyme